MSSYDLDSATMFYHEEKQEIYSLYCDFRELEDDVRVPLDTEDMERYNKILNRGNEIEEEITWNEEQVLIHQNEEMDPENISFNGLRSELNDCMSDLKQFLKYRSEPQYNFDIVFYHGGCPDGECSAWIYKRKMKELNFLTVQFIPMIAGKYPKETDVKNKRILMIDVCPKKEEIEDILKECTYLYILDHHKSGENDVKDISLPPSSYNSDYNCKNLHVIFDMTRCGAQIAWDYFFPLNSNDVRDGVLFLDESPYTYLYFDNVNFHPWFIDVVADRDLWKWIYPQSKALGKHLYFNDYWKDHSKLDSLLSPTVNLTNMELSGNILLEVEKKEIDYVVKSSKLCYFSVPSFSPSLSCEYKVRFCLCNHNVASEAGNLMVKMDDCDFAVLGRYNYEGDEWWLSCRGNNKVDLSQLCRKFGGGGHFNASGFTLKNEAGILQRMFRSIQ